MVHERLSTLKKKNILPTNNSINNMNISKNEASILVKDTCSITIVPVTQTQVVVATQGTKVSIGAPKAPTSGVADLGDMTVVGDLEKLQ